MEGCEWLPSEGLGTRLRGNHSGTVNATPSSAYESRRLAMSASEEERLALLSSLTEILGADRARPLMESLPPMHWDQLVTKDDLRATEDRLISRFEGEFKNFRGDISLEISKQTRTLVFMLCGFALTVWISLLTMGAG